MTQPIPEPVAMPAASRHLNYRGDRTGAVGQVMGPNLLGEVVVAVDADYDAAADRTRVGFAYIGRLPR